MAFIFVPNADGGFDEGDRQTNPDTGVEYIYVDGAWRALGPDISDEFPELDERYVKKAGDIMTGGLLIKNSRNLTFRKADDSDQFAINPNVNSDYFTNIYTFNSADGNGGVRFRVSQDQGVGSSSYDTLVSLSGVRHDIGGVNYRGKLSLNRLQTPTDPDQAANKWYVDNAVGDVDLSGYLPLTGGELTGDLDMNNANIEMLGSRIDFYNDAGDKTMEIAKSGFIKSRDMLRVVRTDGGPILEGRTSDAASDIKVKIDSDGYFQFRDRGELYGDIYLKGNKRYIVQGAANTNVAQFYARTDNIARIENSVSGKTIEIKGLADPVDNRDAVNLQYLNGQPFVTETDVQNAIDTENVHLRLSGGTLTSSVGFKRGSKDNIQFKITPNDGDNYATNISSLYGGQLRFRTSDSTEGAHIGSHIILDPNSGNPQTKIYKVVTPTENDHAANKQYVDEKVASSGGGVPVGSIMIWMNSTVPAGWFKLQGGSFDVNTYPQLHAYLQNTSGYSSGRLPNWSGYYPGEYGDHLTHNLGSKQGYKTGIPSTGGPRSSSGEIPTGATRTFNATGGTNAYSNGKGKVVIDENWDSTTRPKTVVVHYIIKHD